MLRPSRPKKKPPIETSDDNESIGETPIERNNNRFLFSSSFLSSSSLLASIARTRGKQNILLITTEEYNVDFLVKYKEIWHNYFTF